MQNLFKITTKSESSQKFTNGELVSVIYHNIFDFPLTVSEMIKWRAGEELSVGHQNINITGKSGYYFAEGKEGIVYKRTLRKRISERKMLQAKKAARFLAHLPLVKMVAVTGSLSMLNSDDISDIDLMVVTTTGRLWTTRLISHFLIPLFGFKVRKAEDKDQKDKLCLNIWLEDNDLKWKTNRNIYTAHEIAQIVPLVNKSQTYEKFLSDNSWILKFWPNAVKIKRKRSQNVDIKKEKGLIEKLAYKIQLNYMKPKITREVVTPTRALFHPYDWGEVVMSRFNT